MSDFELQPSDKPQPKLLDADPVTTDWPMPEGGPIVLDPKCRASLSIDVERIRALFRGWIGA